MSSTPPRFAISSANVRGNEAHLAGAELHHLRDVLRLRPGDAVGLVDERGRNLSGRIALIDAAAALIRIERVQEPRGAPPLILALAIIKGPRMDLAVEKAAELGASEVWPLICARCVVRDPGAQRLARWRRLAAAGITTREACGNSVRNVTACPYAGVCPDEVFDVTPYARALSKFLLGHPDCQNFGRKFKHAFSGCAQHACGLVSMHDMGMVAVERSEFVRRAKTASVVLDRKT